MKPIVIGVTGGTGSGKTTVARAIRDAISRDDIAVIEQDSYYRAQPNLSWEEKLMVDYDHPFAFDNELLVYHLKELVAGRSIQKPIYDFSVYDRTERTITVEPKPIILVEGIMVLEDKTLREMMDIRIFVDTDPDVRVLRRIMRDIKERGRTLDSVVQQYLTRVKPAHDEFVEPSKKYADVILPEGGHNKVAISMLRAMLQAAVEENR